MKTLHTIYSTFAKHNMAKFLTVLTMLLIVGIGQVWGATATAEFLPSHFSGQGTTSIGSAISATINGVTFACDKGYGTTQIRCYSGSKITISSSNTITAISFTLESKYQGGLSASYTDLSTNSWEKALSSQARITKCVVTYEEASTDPYTVTLEAGSGSVTDTELAETSAGAGVTLPPATIDCGDVEWTFAGWAEASIATETEEAPKTLYEAGDTYKPTSNITLYAVYKRTEEGEGGGSTTTTFTFSSIASANNWSNGTAYTQVVISPITITADGGGNNAKYYTSDQTWRMYNGGSLTITTSTGNITNVSSNPSYTFTVTNGTATCTFSETTKFKSITVTSGGGSTTYYYSYPQCTPETATFTVTFDSDGGSAVVSQTIEEGNKAIKPEDPTKKGYDFVGWYNGNTEFDFDEVITGNITLTAKWKIITYYITYEGLEGATHSNPRTYDVETATITFTAPSNREGFVFKGWTPATIAKGSTGDKTVTANWAKVYTITWLVDGKPYQTGNPTTSVEDGQNITAIPSDPPLLTCAVKFMGWSIESSGSTPEDPSYYSDLFTTLDEAEAINIDDNKTFHAVFATNEETIEGAGTEWVKTELSAVTEGTYALLTDDGHAFNGSISSGHGQVTTNAFSFTDNIATSAPDGTCEITFEAVSSGFKMYNANKGYLYAKDNSSGKLAWQTEETSYWYSNKYSSNNWTYDANDAVLRSYNNGSIRTYSGNTGNLLVLAKKTTSSATVFTAYITSCCETEAPTNDNAEVLSGTSVKLTWEGTASRYHITGDNLSAEGVYTNATSDTISGLTECETYTFYVSAYPKGGCESPKLAIEVTPYIPKTVTFADGSTTTQKTTSCDSKTVTVPNASKDCYTSIWTDENGNEYSNGQTITPTEDMTLTAQYTIIEYEITFKNYDGTVLQTSTINCGTIPTPPANPTREQDAMYGYEFAGWSPAIVPANDDATYTATYNKTKRTYTVDWYVNGKFVKNETVEAGESATAPDLSKNPCGAVLAGWTDAPNGEYVHRTSTLYPGEKPSIEILENKTLYAVFADIDE